MTLTAPLDGDVSVEVSPAAENVLSTDRQTPATLVHIRAYSVMPAGRLAGWYDVWCNSTVLTTLFAPALVPTQRTYACALVTLVHWNGCSGSMFAAPFAGAVSVAVSDAAVKV